MTEHHPFCNKQTGPLEECHFCAEDRMNLFQRYPVDEHGGIEIEKYFPNVQVRQ